jgi:hypothetical protein
MRPKYGGQRNCGAQNCGAGGQQRRNKPYRLGFFNSFKLAVIKIKAGRFLLSKVIFQLGFQLFVLYFREPPSTNFALCAAVTLQYRLECPAFWRSAPCRNRCNKTARSLTGIWAANSAKRFAVHRHNPASGKLFWPTCQDTKSNFLNGQPPKTSFSEKLALISCGFSALIFENLEFSEVANGLTLGFRRLT